MDISGKIIAVLPEQGGTSKNGNEWKKQEYVLETHEQYPKKVCFQIFGADKITQFAIREGEELTVHFDIDSREYQGRWFTNINAWKVERGGDNANATPGNTVPGHAPYMPSSAADTTAPASAASSGTDDLPF
ncbi:MAG: DUF3127 domain-containing protein [Tannerellaceae bacterium]|jgi:hypothetical protein|nr:DUF3127 domain-containing protein [Tannerellaceae bacterium]